MLEIDFSIRVSLVVDFQYFMFIASFSLVRCLVNVRILARICLMSEPAGILLIETLSVLQLFSNRQVKSHIIYINLSQQLK